MEIISYVGYEPARKSIFNVLKTSRKGSSSVQKERVRPNRKLHIKKEAAFQINYTTGAENLTASRVRNAVTLKTVLVVLGRFATEAVEFVKSYYKILIAGAAVIAISIFAGNRISARTAYDISHTGPLAFDSEDSVDIETLNSMMAQFADDNYSSFDEYGNLLDADIEALQAVVIAQPVTYQTYKVQAGDTIDRIARKFGLKNISTLISVNSITNVRTLQEGKKIKVPSMDGILYTVGAGDTINKIIKQYNIKLETFLDVNELSSESLTKGQELFIPGASLDKDVLRNAMGELFQLPIKAKFKWTSPFGKRIDPIKGTLSNHSGTDMACPTGTPIYASRSGTVSFTGVSNVWGNYVIVNHGNGYQTLYAHMSKILVKKGQAVDQNSKLGLVGSTGYSTGPHLHFTVYKNGQLVDPMTVLKK